MRIKEAQRKLYAGACDRGWYSGELGERTPLRIASLLCLIHSEVSEALESLRKGEMETYIGENGKPEGFPSEIADIIIRTMDMAEFLGIDLEKEIHTKDEYNKTRGHRHGGKAL